MTPRPRSVAVAAAVAGLVVLTGCSSSTQHKAAATGPVISVKLLAFNPTEQTVKVGDTVTWRNDEEITHTITSGRFLRVDPITGLRADQKPDGLFGGPLARIGATYTFTFTKAGTYTYFCSIHQGMNARVVVTPN